MSEIRMADFVRSHLILVHATEPRATPCNVTLITFNMTITLR